MSKRVVGVIVFVTAILLTLTAVVLAGAGRPPEGGPAFAFGGDVVALIKLDGAITDETVAPFRTGRERGNVYAQLRRAELEDSVKAVVLRVNSPGGSAAASQALYDQIRRIRERGKKVVVYFTDVAASGGYYVAAAGDRIVAQPATITGSIGVIVTAPDLRGLLEKIGVEMRVVKSGPYKDILSPTSDFSPEERAIVEKLVQDTLDQFVKVVAEGRRLPEADVRRIADGRIFSGTEALRLGLVDEVGDQHRAVRLAAELAGLRGEPRVVLYEQPRPSGLLGLLGEVMPASTLREWLPNARPGVYYEWRS